MQRTRIIPTLLLQDGGLVKTIKFKNPKYVGDPINAVRIFNEKEVDELVLLDIKATIEKAEPNFKEIEEIVSEAFMPIGYGGGINKIEHVEKLFKIGIEKIILNSAAFTNEKLIQEASNIYGNQSIVVSIDVKKDLWGEYNIYTHSGSKKVKGNLIEIVNKFQNLGAGEILINSIDKEGTMTGYDIALIEKVSKELNIPVIASGGAGGIKDFVSAIKFGASAVAGGSIFIYQGVHRAVLISYIKSQSVENKIKKNNL
ncbi:MAG: imidazole glycerol phosphate synthase subunit HisF [Bacteroidetes bacterium]|nr:imidazole glycerol phosphate synthase subunit HisF [Bacteroidota bacterium]